MTENRRDSDDETTMREVSHTNPYTDESMGSLFEHGVTVVADGGRRGAADEDGEPFDGREAPPEDDDAEPFDDREAARADGDGDATADADATPMKDVSHEAPEGGHGNRMFERVGDTADVSEE